MDRSKQGLERFLRELLALVDFRFTIHVQSRYWLPLFGFRYERSLAHRTNLSLSTEVSLDLARF